MIEDSKNKQPVKVAFLLNVDKGWLGGLNYYRNLLSAVEQYGSGRFEFEIYTGKNVDISLLKDYPQGIFIIKSAFFTRNHPLEILRRIAAKLTGYDLLGEWYLLRSGVSIISHVAGRDKYKKIKTTTWIPDFQHKYCKEFFSKDELYGRDVAFFMQAKNRDLVILSSYDAMYDFKRFIPQYEDKAEVLQFVPTLKFSDSVDTQLLEKRYNIIDKFFYVPNQYWLHKNHMVVLRAIKLLKDKGHEVKVVSTGNTADYRAPHLMKEIQSYIREYHLENNYRILGLIPYDDVQLLSECCHAYINPSLFEGWSTTVEEAKYRGKRIILSDLGIHKEQNPKYGIFFDPHNAENLAEKMWQVWNEERVQEPKEKLIEYNKVMKKKFAERFEQILDRANSGQSVH